MAWPTSPIHGKLARVTEQGTAIDYSSRWSINWVKDAAVYGRQGKEYKEASPGQCSWTGSAEFLFVRSSEQKTLQNMAVSTESTITPTSTLTTSLRFCFDTTVNQLRGTVVVTGMTIDAGVGDMVRASFTFQGSGALEFSS